MAERVAGEPQDEEATLIDFETLDLPISVLSRPEKGMHYAMHLGISVVGAAPNLTELYAQAREFVRTQKTHIVTLGEREIAWRFAFGIWGFTLGVLLVLVVFHG